MILKIICIHTIWLSGKKPSELDIDIFMNYYRSCKIKGNKRYVNIVADHLEAIENKIALNLEDIRIRTIWYGRCLKICFFTICIIVCILIAEHSTSVWALVHHWFEFHCPVWFEVWSVYLTVSLFSWLNMANPLSPRAKRLYKDLNPILRITQWKGIHIFI